jgi:hypothetical protein
VQEPCGGPWIRLLAMMFRAVVVGVIAAGVLATAAIAQKPAANVLSAALRSHLSAERFQVVTSVRGLPLGVRDQLQAMFRSSYLEIAEPGAPFRATDVVIDASLPVRRLSLAACSMDHCLVYYERGGIAHTWQVMLFHWTPEATRFEWGGYAPAGLTTVDQLRKLALSGAVRSSGVW